MGRAPCCDKANVQRGPWTPEEDAALKGYIHKHGTGGNWIAFPTKAGLKRCGKSCRLRWLNYLRPGIKHGGFTDEEDRIIFSLYSQMGSRWSVIASQLDGRTDNDVKNYWNTKLKKKLLAAKSSITNTTTNIPILPPISHIENYNHGFSTSILTDISYGLTINTQTLIHDPIQFPCQGVLTTMSEFSTASTAMNSHSVSSSTQEALSVSGSDGGGGEDHNGLLMDFGFGFPYDFVNGVNGGFWSQEKVSDHHEVVPISTSSPCLVDSTYADIKPQGLLQSVINQY